MAALAATVVLAVIVPVAAAVAGTVLPEVDVEPLAPATQASSAPASSGSASSAPASSPPASPGPAEPSGASGASGASGPSGKASERVTSVCGPQLVSPAGVEAQTCVLAEGDKTWARTYFRNATNTQLRGVLSMMRPDGRTVRVPCVLPAAQQPGQCQTPRERTVARAKALDRGNQLGYAAVAEIASPDGGRLLLRAGSNSERS